MDFYNVLKQDDYVTSALNKNNFRQMVISIDNYPIFYREKKYNGYFNFFRKYYLQ
jgi:hypothetical protein